MRVLIWILSVTLIVSSCKSKMEKKDQTLEEMQEKDDNSHYQPVLESADATPVYKQIGDSVSMHLNIYYPKDHTSGDPKPVVIYFFSGGFVQGSPIQWEETCKYLASRGMVAITADYRVISRNGGNAINCVVDAKSAVRYVREHAAEMHIDPARVVVAGGSAGGLLAIECALNDSKWEDPQDNKHISCVPDLMVLQNPVISTTEFKFRIEKFKDNKDTPDSLSHAAELNPLTHMRPNMPPAIVFHGTLDPISKFKIVKEYQKLYTDAGGEFDVHPFAGEKHGFAAMNKKGGKNYVECLRLTDSFFVAHGYLSGAATIQLPEAPAGN